MTGKAIAITVFILLACLIVHTAVAQNAQANSIQGYVVDSNGQPVPYASIYLYSDGTLVNIWNNPSVSDLKGHYAFDNVTPGNYSITASRNFFNVTTTTSVSTGDQVLNVTIPADTGKLRDMQL